MQYSEERNRKISESRKGEKNPMYGRTCPTRKIFKTREEFIELYVNQKRSISQIAKEWKCCLSTIHHWKRKYNIYLTEDEIKIRKGYGVKNRDYYKGYKNDSGYLSIVSRDHPNCGAYGYVRKHRLVVEEFLGRYLDKKEQVHHADYNKMNNKLENLVVLSSAGEHTKFHKYLELIAMWLLKVLPERPEPFKFEKETLFCGKMISEIDLSNGKWS